MDNGHDKFSDSKRGDRNAQLSPISMKNSSLNAMTTTGLNKSSNRSPVGVEHMRPAMSEYVVANKIPL